MYRIELKCLNVPERVGAQAAIDITEGFKSRTWHQNVTCRWDGSSLVLSAENDYDDNGLALMDEFSDEISARIDEGFDGDILVCSIEEF